MKPLRLSAPALAQALHVPVSRITAVVRERRNIDGEMALRLQQYFGMSARFWMNWQRQYDLELAEDRLARLIRREVRLAPRDRKAGELKIARTDRTNAGPRATSLRMTT